MAGPSPPLNECRPMKMNLLVNRLHILFNGIAIVAWFYYRATHLCSIIKTRETPLVPYLIVCFSESVLTFLWILDQAYKWRPVKRYVRPESLPEDEKLPPLDVFICTADPSKEPSQGVMNTVISAMAMDYPPDKLAIFLSDDGGSYVTLQAMQEAWKFSRYWIPFVKKYEMKTRCPEAYFSEAGSAHDKFSNSSEFAADKKKIEQKYQEFMDNLEKNSVNAKASVSRDHPPNVQVITDEDSNAVGSDLKEMPLLVYVAREKRPSHPHHFKGGALNVLLRVSAVISNAPYFLVLDCDMYCNDPSAARQAICFYLDPKISSDIAWVQFPQKFRDMGKHDIYGGSLNPIWRRGQGLDGLRGPTIYGCNFVMTREAIYGLGKASKGNVDINQLKKSFGPSNEFIKTINKSYRPQLPEDRKCSGELQKEIQLLASCTHDKDTEWGHEASIYFESEPCFLGASPMSLNDMLVQQTRWSFGLMQIGLSKFSPLIYAPLRMSILQSMCYSHLILECLYAVPFYLIAIIPPISLLYGIPLYPKVSDPFFLVFAFIFVSSLLKHVQEVLSYGDDIMTALYELRVFVMKCAACYFYANLNAVLDRLGLLQANFSLTNKVVDDEQVRRYEQGIYDFQVSPMLLAPLCSLYILNLATLTLGIPKLLNKGDELFVQAAISLVGLILNYHLLEGMVLRTDKGRISPSLLLLSVGIAAAIWVRKVRNGSITSSERNACIERPADHQQAIVLTCLWIVQRPYIWRPVKRTVYPERLPEDEKLPPIDVFICTADPSKEPSLGVMNTVISAMALDYPPDKLAVYLQDDGGSYVTLNAVRESWKFSRYWIPYCRKYEVKIRCPDAYFSAAESAHDKFISSSEFAADRKKVEQKYEEFKENLEKNSVNAKASLSRDHPPIVEVMTDEDGNVMGSDLKGVPLLVYVAREKRPNHPHHFKGGALNTLLRVSAVLSNAPYFLVLDCDMYCYDPSSARQAMCFYLDPKIAPKIAWVQFPQKFRDLSEHDIYGGSLNAIWRKGLGLDGARGPTIYGCNFFMTREAIYGMGKIDKNVDLNQLKKSFGSSNELLKSLYKDYKPQLPEDRKCSDALQKELQLLASCTYDNGTQWGEEVGYMYFTVVEDSITSLVLHGRGWISVFLDPDTPCFLGSSTTNLNDMLVQQTRWAFGLMQIGLSKYSPLLYGLPRMPALQAISYCAPIFECLTAIPFYGLAIIPQICLVHGIPLYPKVSDPFFIAVAIIFISSQLKHIQDVLVYGDSFMTAVYELRVWLMKGAACYFYATLNAVLDRFGLHEATFSLTNKAVDEERARLFELGLYDFQVSTMLLVPICALYLLNLASFIIGIPRILQKGDELFAQAVLPLYGVIVGYHLFQGMFLRKDKGRISSSIILLSTAVAAIILCCGSIIVFF
ncbi:hypothetical protein BUALT_Bualt14G0108500 [Buddleja alternifolia]|uniref:Uncharacterized protein n=1 Tax=Buddleja alternifolia TaxID=168488 RepID=A0AAV6WQ46_9LAMI|nr:hypothetical protein BUALT_Bualt14G0108500 [Buddleja alternifolia]